MFTHFKIALIALVILNCSAVFSQTVFWTETFDNGCAKGCLAGGVNTGNGAWSTIDGGSEARPNLWYVSCAEDGHLNGDCGTACAGGTATGASLHVGANDGFVTDPGAAYDAGGPFACNTLGICTASNQQAISPQISTVGYSGISLSFDYIEYGQAGQDYCSLYYSTDGGVTWNLITVMPQTSCCGGACDGDLQGSWTGYTTNLPPACDNIANLEISFLWINDDDGNGFDPSFAADNVVLSYLTSLPIELLSFTATPKNKIIELDWSTASQTNNDYFTLERSPDGINFGELQKIGGAGTNSQLLTYSFIDEHLINGINYYRLRQTDFDGKFTNSNIIAADASDENDFDVKSIYHSMNDQKISLCIFTSCSSPFSVYLTDVTGRIVSTYNFTVSSSAQNDLMIPVSDLSSGIYLLKMNNGFSSQVRKIIL